MENKKILSWLDNAKDSIIELEKLLTAIPAIAPESDGDGEWEKAKALVAWLKAKGFQDIKQYDAPDSRVSAGKRPNVVATIKGKDSKSAMWVMSHLDVVPAGDLALWNTDPFTATVDGDKIYGRGVEDNQQGLVSSVFAALSLLENKIQPTHDIKLLFVADEEYGSEYGVQWLLKNTKLFSNDDLIIIPDSGCPEGTEIEIAEKNVCWLKVHAKGKQCHASIPEEGANAFLANCELALSLYAMEKDVFSAVDEIFVPNKTTITPTKKEANIPNINTVPADDIFYVDMRILPRYTVDEVLAEARKRANVVGVKYGVSFDLETVQRTESPSTSVDAPVVLLLKNAIEDVYGVEGKAVGVGGGTVAAHLRQEGFPCVVWSRQDETMHSPNEYTRISNIIGDAKVFAMLMNRD